MEKTQQLQRGHCDTGDPSASDRPAARDSAFVFVSSICYSIFYICYCYCTDILAAGWGHYDPSASDRAGTQHL